MEHSDAPRPIPTLEGFHSDRVRIMRVTDDLLRIERDDLQVAWDFTVASEENLAGPLLAMRDERWATAEALLDGSIAASMTSLMARANTTLMTARRIIVTVSPAPSSR